MKARTSGRRSAPAYRGVSAGLPEPQATEQRTLPVVQFARGLVRQKMPPECHDRRTDIGDVVAERLQLHGIVECCGDLGKGRIAPQAKPLPGQRLPREKAARIDFSPWGH